MPRSLTRELLSWLCISWVFNLAGDFTYLTKIAQRQSAGNLLDTADSGDSKQDLPIPSTILGIHICLYCVIINGLTFAAEKIENDRQNSIKEAIEIIGSTIAKYRGSTTCCGTTNFRKDDNFEKNYACDATVLGSLLKSAAALELWPPAEYSCLSLSWNAVVGRIAALEIVSLCDCIAHEPGEDPESPRRSFGAFGRSYSPPFGRSYSPSPARKTPLNHGVKDDIITKTDIIENRLVSLRLTNFK